MLTAMSVGTANLINIARMKELAYRAPIFGPQLLRESVTRGR
jgi:hypothetical protein